MVPDPVISRVIAVPSVAAATIVGRWRRTGRRSSSGARRCLQLWTISTLAAMISCQVIVEKADKTDVPEIDKK
ncbi:hypothetical protein ABZP36_028222 [Zizania latifolia]